MSSDFSTAQAEYGKHQPVVIIGSCLDDVMTRVQLAKANSTREFKEDMTNAAAWANNRISKRILDAKCLGTCAS